MINKLIRFCKYKCIIINNQSLGSNEFTSSCSPIGFDSSLFTKLILIIIETVRDQIKVDTLNDIDSNEMRLLNFCESNRDLRLKQNPLEDKSERERERESKD